MGIANLGKKAEEPAPLPPKPVPQLSPPSQPSEKIEPQEIDGPLLVEQIASLAVSPDDPSASLDARQARCNELAKAFEALSKQIAKLSSIRASIGLKILPLLKDKEVSPVVDYSLPGGGIVKITKGGGRRAGKGDIVKRWANEGVAFWNALPAGKKEYVSYKSPTDMGDDPELD